MARIRDPDGRLQALCSLHLIGRSRAAHTRIPRDEVSAQHALITWQGEAWGLRDLGSRNGTWLDARRLPVGVNVPLQEGSRVGIGAPEITFTVLSVEPPVPSAQRGDQIIEGGADLLVLPSEDDPRFLVLRDDELGWRLATEEGGGPVSDGDLLRIDGQDWRLSIPEIPSRTAEPRDLSGATTPGVIFKVSEDEEYVEIALQVGGEAMALPSRAHHYLLLTLARARIQDQAQGVSDAQQGWLYTEDLIRMLRYSTNQLYVALHRARREVQGLGLDPAIELVEHRRTTHQLRFGLSLVQIGRL